MNLYDIKVINDKNEEISLSEYKDRVLLIVNTATGCGFTPQYKDLQALYLKYKDRGLVILDFPCNQFGNQASGLLDEINTFCELNFKTTFPRFAKILVNGKEASPLYKYLKKQKGSLLGSSIKWNFTKFLIDKNGQVVKRYAPNVEPLSIEQDILTLL